MTGAVGLATGRAPVSVGLYQVVGLLFEKRVQRVLDRSPDELLELVAHGLLVECYDGFGHGLASWSIESGQLDHTDGMGHVFWYLDYAAFKVRKKLYVTGQARCTQWGSRRYLNVTLLEG